MPHEYDGTNYVPHRELVVFASDIIINYMSERLVPISFRRDIDSTRQAIAELLEHEDMSKFPLQKVYAMAHELIGDYLENQEDLKETWEEQDRKVWGE